MGDLVSLRRGLGIEWKVKNFLELNHLATQAFSFRGSTCKFVLRRREIGQLRENFAIYLERANSNEERNILVDAIRIRTFIEDRSKNPWFPIQYNEVYGGGLIWMRFLSSLRENEETILTDGTVTFVFIFLESSASENEIETEVSTQTDVEDTLSSFECLSHDLQHLLDDSLLSDVTLKCGNRTIPAHRNILSARSGVFHAMLRNDMSESRTGIVEVSDMESSTLDQLVQYLYSGKVSELSADIAEQLYAAADKYAIDSLKSLCVNFMKKKLTKDNAYSILALADAHADKDLKDCILSFIVNTDLIRNEGNWFGFHEKCPKLAAEVLYHAYKKK